MSDPVPLTEEDRVFSFGEDVNLSQSADGRPAASQEGGESPPGSVERSSSSKKGAPRVSRGSVRFSPEQVNIGIPYDSTRPVSGATYSSSSSVPYVESSKTPPSAARNLGDTPEEPSDYDVFLQKSREDYERDKQRNWPTVEIDDASFTNQPSIAKNATRRQLFAMVRKILRILQVFTSMVVLSLMSFIVSKVRDSYETGETAGQEAWHDPLILWPEYFVAAVSGSSFLISLLSVLAIFFIDKLSETKSQVGLMTNFCLNLVLLISWITAVLVLKVNSSTDFVWGFACAHSGINNPSVDYTFICNRETVTWAMTMLSSAVESGVSIAFILTFLRHQSYQAEKAEARRKAEMRLSVHRTMTGRGSKRNSGKRISQGWESGGENVRPVIAVHGP